MEAERGRLEWNQVRISSAEFVLEVIDNHILPDEEKGRFDNALYLLGVINRARLSWGVVEELRNTGNIQLIKDLKLRRALTDMENHFRWFDQLVEEEAYIIRVHRTELTKHYRILNRNRDENTDSVELEYDLADFWEDQELLNSIAKIAEYQGFADSVLQNTVTRLQALRDQIATARAQINQSVRFGT